MKKRNVEKRGIEKKAMKKRLLVLLFCSFMAIFALSSFITGEDESESEYKVLLSEGSQDSQQAGGEDVKSVGGINLDDVDISSFISKKDDLKERFENLEEDEKEFIVKEMNNVRERWSEQRRNRERKSCEPEDKDVEVCTEQYDPVCGYNENETGKTYSNPCFACMESEVEYWISGECGEQQEEDMAPESVGNGRDKAKLHYKGELKDLMEDEEKMFVKPKNSNKEFLASDIKMIPERAAERAIEQLHLNCEKQNCTVELIERKKGNESKVAYEIQSRERVRLFGLVGMNMKKRTQVDSSDGEILNVKRPWWSFLAREESNEDEEESNETKTNEEEIDETEEPNEDEK